MKGPVLQLLSINVEMKEGKQLRATMEGGMRRNVVGAETRREYP